MRVRPFSYLEQAATGPQDWTPAQITTQVWIDPTDNSTLTTLSGQGIGGADLIVSVADKSGNNHDLIQTENTAYRFTLNTTGINGVQSMLAASDAMYLDYHSNVQTNQQNWFFVTQPDDTTPSSVNAIIRRGYGNASLGGTIRYTSGGLGGFWRGTVSNPSISTKSTPLGTSIVEMLVSGDGSSSVMKLYEVANQFSTSNFSGILKNQNDDVRPIIGGAYTSDTWTSGDFADRFSGNIGEIVWVAGDNVTTDTQQKIQGYLAWKWGLQGDLPSDHPYKNAKPTIEPAPPAAFALYLGASDFSTLDGNSANNGLVKIDNTGTIDATFLPTISYNTFRFGAPFGGNYFGWIDTNSSKIVNATDGTLIGEFSVGSRNNCLGSKGHGDYLYFTGNNMFTYNGTTAGNAYRVDISGNVDTTFRSNFSPTNYVQPIMHIDDSIAIFCGSYTNFGTGERYLTVVNTSDGTINSTFHAGRTSDFNGSVNSATKVGDIIVAVGNGFSAVGGTTAPRIVAFNLDGTINTTFMTNAGTGFPTSPNVVPRFVRALDSTSFIVFFAGPGATTANYNGTSIPDRACVINTDGTLNTTKTNYLGSGFNNLPRYAVEDDNGYHWISGEGFTSLNGTSYNNLVQIDFNTGTINPTYSYVSGMRDNTNNPLSGFLVSLHGNN